MSGSQYGYKKYHFLHTETYIFVILMMYTIDSVQKIPKYSMISQTNGYIDISIHKIEPQGIGECYMILLLQIFFVDTETYISVILMMYTIDSIQKNPKYSICS